MQFFYISKNINLNQVISGKLYNKYLKKKIMLRKVGIALVSACTGTSYFMDESKAPDSSRHAICILYPDNNSNVRGVVSLSQ